MKRRCSNQSTRFFILILLMIGIGKLSGQWQQTNTQSLLAADADYFSGGYAIASDGKGGALLCWNSLHSGQYYVQKISSNGIMQWGKLGVKSPIQYFQSAVQMIHDAAGGSYVLLCDNNWESNLYLQHHDAGGRPLWPIGSSAKTGVLLSTSARIGFRGGYDMVLTTQGSVVVVWTEESRTRDDRLDVIIQRIDNTGQVQLAAGGSVLCEAATENDTSPRLSADENDGVYVLWYNDYYDGLYAQHCTSNLTYRWFKPGLELHEWFSVSVPTIITDGLGGIHLFWSRYKHIKNISDPVYYADSYQFFWQQGIKQGFKAISDGVGGAIICWPAQRSDDQTRTQLFMVRVNGAGNTVAPEHVIVEVVGTLSLNDLVLNGGNEVIVTYTTADKKNVYAQKVQLLSAQSMWRTTGIRIDRTTKKYKTNVHAIPDKDNGVLVSYIAYDDSLSPQLLLQQVNADSTLNKLQAPSGSAGVLSLPGGKKVNDYRLVSIPAQLEKYDAQKIFGDHLGVYDKRKWRVFDCQDGKTVSAEYPNVRSLLPGVGLFVLSRDAGSIDVGSGYTLNDWSYSINLHKGYNLIGNPFNKEIPVSQIALVSNRDSTLVIWEYEQGWKKATVLKPWQGYALGMGDTDSTARLVVYRNATSASPAAAGPVTPPLWQIGLHVTTESCADFENWIGLAPDCSDGQDRRDVPEPPNLGTQGVSLTFPHPEWSDFFANFSSDFRTPSDSGNTWNFSIRNDLSGPADLSVSGIEKVPHDLDVYLIDQIRGIHMDLRKQNHYNLIAKEQTLQLVVGRKAYVRSACHAISTLPVASGISYNFPNPFNGSTTLMIELAQDEKVSVRILNILGEEVDRLLSEKSLAAGQHSVIWTGRNAFGHTMASGVYFCQVQTERWRRTVKMVMLP